MGYIRRPSYYKNFRCIGSACTDNCCIGWEIEVDADTLAYYQTVSGSFGEKLRASISAPAPQTGTAHFFMDKQNRCPLLDACNLCEVYKHLGEQHMVQICTDHPRYFGWFSGGREDGLGLCCEAAAHLILQETGYPQWEILQEPDISDTDEKTEHGIEQTLFSMREQLFHLIKPEASVSFDEKTDAIYRAARAMQDQYDAVVFGFPADETEEDLFCWSKAFWNEACLTQIFDQLLQMEINRPDWKDHLLCIKIQLSDLLHARPDFLQFYQKKCYEYDQLLLYFVYRHFMNARDDDAVREKVQFALISTAVIQALDIFHWMTHGTLSHWEQICICKAYSREIEYDEENTACLSNFIFDT